MNRSGWSLAIVMIALGGIAVSPGGARAAMTPVAWALVVGLVGAGGLLLIVRRPIAAWVALAVALATVAGGVAAWTGHPQWGLPVSPPLSVGIGVYICLRLEMARASQRSFRPDERE